MDKNEGYLKQKC